MKAAFFLLITTSLQAIEAYTQAIEEWFYALAGSPWQQVEALLNKYPELIHEEHQGTHVEGTRALSVCVMSTRQNKLETLQGLIAHGAQIDHQNRSGRTALMYAAFSGQEQVVRLLLDEKANPNLKDLKGYTAFEMACSEGQAEVARLLRGRPQEPAGPPAQRSKHFLRKEAMQHSPKQYRTPKKELAKPSENTHLTKVFLGACLLACLIIGVELLYTVPSKRSPTPEQPNEENASPEQLSFQEPSPPCS